jgi:molybdenum cofactor cytidylyltransferase
VQRIVGIILAAGSAQRMGEPKQLMVYRDKPLLQHVIDAAEASALDEVILVTGASADVVEAATRLTRAVAVRNPDPDRGNMSSLAVGAAATADADGFVVLMGDQPDLPGPKLLWRLLAEDDTGRVIRLATEDAAPIDVNTPDDFRRLDLP